MWLSRYTFLTKKTNMPFESYDFKLYWDIVEKNQWHMFKVYSLISFDICTSHIYLFPFEIILSYLFPGPQTTSALSSVTKGLVGIFLEFYINGMMYYTLLLCLIFLSLRSIWKFIPCCLYHQFILVLLLNSSIILFSEFLKLVTKLWWWLPQAEG